MKKAKDPLEALVVDDLGAITQWYVEECQERFGVACSMEKPADYGIGPSFIREGLIKLCKFALDLAPHVILVCGARSNGPDFEHRSVELELYRGVDTWLPSEVDHVGIVTQHQLSFRGRDVNGEFKPDSDIDQLCGSRDRLLNGKTFPIAHSQPFSAVRTVFTNESSQ